MRALHHLRDEGVALRNEGGALTPDQLLRWESRTLNWEERSAATVDRLSARDGGFFRTINVMEIAEFQGARIHSPEHLLRLRVVNEKIRRLESFIRTGAL
jgi:hypothetical protein